jgi:hypothetical protein
VTVFVQQFCLCSANHSQKCAKITGMVIAQSTHCSDMKPPDTNPHFSPNWTWPEKTWFRERLNAIKAQELESNRKRTDNSQNSSSVKSTTPTPDEPVDEVKP